MANFGTFDLGNIYSTGTQNLLAKTQVMEQANKLAQQQRDAETAGQLPTLRQQAIAGGTPYQNPALDQLAALSPETAKEIQTFLTSATTEQRKAYSDANKMIGQIAFQIDPSDPAAPQQWDAGVDFLARQGIDVSRYKGQYSPQLRDQALAVAGLTEKVMETFGQPVAGVDVTTGEDVYFRAGSRGGTMQVPGVRPREQKPLVQIGEDKERAAMAGVQAKRFEKVISDAENSANIIAQLDQLDAIDVETGALEPAKAAIAAVVQGLGAPQIASYIANVDTAQSFNAVSERMVNDILNAATGPQTDQDANRIRATISALGDSPGANQFKNDSLRAIALRNIERGDFIENLVDQGKTFSQANKEWNAYKRQTPMLSGVVKNPETGLPMFYYQFRQHAKQIRPGITEKEIIEAWRSKHDER